MNAAEPGKIKSAEQRERHRARRETEDLRFILSSPEGRRFVWRLLAHAGVFRSIWEPSAKIHYNSGLQDFGHFIQAEVTKVDLDASLLMQREAMQREREEVDAN